MKSGTFMLSLCFVIFEFFTTNVTLGLNTAFFFMPFTFLLICKFFTATPALVGLWRLLLLTVFPMLSQFLLCCASKLRPRGRESFLHRSLFILSGRYCRSGARGKDVKCRDRSGFAAIWENSPSVGCDGIRHGGETCATRNPGFYDGAWWRNTRSFLLLTIYSLS